MLVVPLWQHTLVLVHNGPTSSARQVIDSRYQSLISEFYALAAAANQTAELAARMRFAQIDISKNELPPHTPLSDPKGVSLLCYLMDEVHDEPQSAHHGPTTRPPRTHHMCGLAHPDWPSARPLICDPMPFPSCQCVNLSCRGAA